MRTNKQTNPIEEKKAQIRAEAIEEVRQEFAYNHNDWMMGLFCTFHNVEPHNINGNWRTIIALKPEAQKELDELQETLRLLPLEKRNILADFILEEREHGIFYIEKEIMEYLTSGMIMSPIRPNNKHIDSEILFSVYSEDLRELPNIDSKYPLYIECQKGNLQDIADKIHKQATILVSLREPEVINFARNVSDPDTPEEIAHKITRHEKITKWANALHHKKYTTNNYYRMLIDEFHADDLCKEAISKTPTIKTLTEEDIDIILGPQQSKIPTQPTSIVHTIAQNGKKHQNG